MVVGLDFYECHSRAFTRGRERLVLHWVEAGCDILCIMSDEKVTDTATIPHVGIETPYNCLKHSWL